MICEGNICIVTNLYLVVSTKCYMDKTRKSCFMLLIQCAGTNKGVDFRFMWKVTNLEP